MAVIRREVQEGQERQKKLQERQQKERAKWERIVADKNATLADKDAVLADKNAALADKDAVLADKDAALAEQARSSRSFAHVSGRNKPGSGLHRYTARRRRTFFAESRRLAETGFDEKRFAADVLISKIHATGNTLKIKWNL
jgi:hypothetical protein